MRLLIFLYVFSTGLFAGELKTFDFYKENLPSLISDISKVESFNSRVRAVPFQSALDNMNTLKTNFDFLSNPLKLELLQEAAETNNWMNVIRKTQSLVAVCETSNTKDMNSCKSGTEDLLAFITNSNLSIENKDFIKNFLTNYLAQLNAISIINSEFIQRFNQNIEAANLEMTNVERPINVVMKTAPVVVPAVVADPVVSNSIRYGEYILSASLLGIMLISYSLFIYFSNKKVIKNFYVKLFTVAKKNNQQLKIFGNLPSVDAKFVKSIQMPLLNTIYLSRSVSNKAQINFKKKDKSISVEIHYDTSRPIQKVVGLEKEKAFEESLRVLQELTKSNGGEFIYLNNFNSFGDVVRSGLVFHIPN